MSVTVNVAGFEGRSVVVEPPGLTSSAKLIVDGQPAPQGRKKGEYRLVRNDGREVTASFRAAYPDILPVLVVDGQTYRLAPPLPWYEMVWAAFPLVLILLGGAIGGALGGAAAAANFSLFRSHLPKPAQYAATGAVGCLAFAAWLALAVALGVRPR